MDSASAPSEWLLSSPHQLPSRDADPKELTRVHPEDAAVRLRKELGRNSQEPQGLMKLRRPLRVLAEVRANVHCQCLSSLDRTVEPCFYQLNWPKEVLQRWAKEKEERERNLCLDVCQDTDIGRSNTLDEAAGEKLLGNGELEVKTSDSCSTCH